MSGPCLSPSVADRPLRPATHRRLGEPLPHQQANGPRAHPRPEAEATFGTEPREAGTSSGISRGFPRLFLCLGQITHVLLTRSPLEYPRRGLSARLACVKHAASVRPEPGSNSPRTACENDLPARGPKARSDRRPVSNLIRREIVLSQRPVHPSSAPSEDDACAGWPTRFPSSPPALRPAGWRTNPTSLFRCAEARWNSSKLLSFQRPARLRRDQEDYQRPTHRASRGRLQKKTARGSPERTDAVCHRPRRCASRAASRPRAPALERLSGDACEAPSHAQLLAPQGPRRGVEGVHRLAVHPN